MYQFNREEYNKRMEWYVDARFGMFIHWGLYSIPARGEWIRSFEEITKEDIDYVVDSLKEIVAYIRQMSPLYEDFLKNKNR